MGLYETFSGITDRLAIPADVKIHTSHIVEKSVNGNYSKADLENQLGDLQYSLEVKPLSYVDERKFYTCADGAYKIYEQLSQDKNLKSSAWCLANIAMYSWYFKSLFGLTLTGRDVERAVDEALRAPTYFMIKNCLIGTLQAAMVMVPAYVGFSAMGMEEPQRHFISFYVISMIIDFIKVYMRIRSNEVTGLTPIKSSATQKPK